MTGTSISPLWRQPAHHPAYARLLCAFVRSRGGNADAVLAAAGMDWAQLVREERHLSHERLVPMVLTAIRLTGCDALGLEMSRAVQTVAHGEAGTAFTSSATLRQAMEITARYISLRTRAFRFSFSAGAQEGRVVMTERFDLGPAREAVTELTAINIYNGWSSAFGYALDKVDLDLPYPPTPWADRYREFLPGTVRFNQPVAALRVPAAVLDTPSLMADAAACATASQSCERALALQEGADGNDAARIRAALALANGPFPTLAEMAARFAMSPSTLIRRLKQSGTSYQELRDDTRRELALWYLEHSDEPIATIAERLGYLDVSNFSATFRRWFGETPSARRRKGPADAPALH